MTIKLRWTCKMVSGPHKGAYGVMKMDSTEPSVFVDNFGNLAEKISKFGNRPKLHPDHLFRGQSDSQWSLEPSFARVAKQRGLCRNKALQLEWESVLKFSMSAKNLLPLTNTFQLSLQPGRIDLPGWGPLMQHYGAPTRQLDWSMSTWVALYFSCYENEESDGALWIADFKKVVDMGNKKLAALKAAQNATDAFLGLLREPSAPEIVMFSMAVTSNERIDAQQGRFSLCTNPLANHADEMYAANGLEKIVIDRSLKSVIMEELHKMNINASSLFPGIDGLGKSIREFCKLWDNTSQIEVSR